MNSEDKYDKKEFQARMETQFLNMIKSQFPIDEDDDPHNDTKNEI
jgi:hypothetical protein